MGGGTSSGSSGGSNIDGDAVAELPILSGSPFAMAIAGNLLYAADWGYNTGVLSIIDVSEPSQPRLLGTHRSGTAEIHGLAVDGEHAYLANDSLGLTVVDVSNTARPRLVGSRTAKDGPTYSHCVALANLGAPPEPYVLMGGFYGRALSLFPDQNPKDLGNPVQYTSPSSNVRDIMDIAQADGIGYLFVGNGEDWMGVETVDLSPLPGTPNRLGTVSIPIAQYGGWGRERLVGSTLYLSTSAHTKHVGGLHIVDVTNPITPEIIGNLDLPDLGNVSWEGAGLDVAGLRAYLVGKTSLHVVDVSHPRNPVEIATLRLPTAYANHVGGNVLVNGDYAYAAVPKVESERGGIIVFHIAYLQ
jgi:hypothetical protein